MRSFCRKTHVHKIPRFRGGGWGGGGSADFIFMGARIFLRKLREDLVVVTGNYFCEIIQSFFRTECVLRTPPYTRRGTSVCLLAFGV